MMKEISRLHEWFEANQRDFPWRVEKTPYKVLVSEIMLQQTRASVVVPYFERWMEAFPTFEVLAEAPLEKVIKLWEGLGYYSRARRLHAAARHVVEKFGGRLPETKDELFSIPGLGPYTVGALLSFGFQKRSAAVDGNVSRVLARYFLLEESLQKAAVKRKLEELAEKSLDEKKPWVTAEALIELGVSLCSRKPKCDACPLQSGCLGYQTGKAEYLPIQASQPSITALFRLVFLIEAERSILVRKEAEGRLMEGLYEFPYIEKREPQPCNLPSAVHSFTRYKAHLFPRHVVFSEKKEGLGFLRQSGILSKESYIWVEKERLAELPFSAGHRKILHHWMGL